MTQTWKHYGTMMLAVTGLLLAPVPSAFAGDAKILPGVACVPASGAGSGIVNWTTGAIVNNLTTYTATAHCPVVRDNTVDTWQRIEIRVDDRNTAADVSCTFYDITSNGGFGSYRTLKSTGTGLQTLSFSKPSCSFNCGTIGDPYVVKPYLLSCTLPARQTGVVDGWSKLLYYYVDEK